MLRNPALIPPPSRLYPLKTLAFPILSRLIPPYPAFLKYPVPLQKVAGIGDHETLMKTCKTYQEIARSQLSEAELGGAGA